MNLPILPSVGGKLAQLWLVCCLTVLSVSLSAQVVSCPYNGVPSSAVSIDTDDRPAGMTMVTDDYDVFPAALASRVSVIGNASVTMCYYGDMDNANETWSVTISGQNVANTEGNFTPPPTAANPRCRTYVIDNAAFQNDLTADGDLDYSFNLTGAGWEYAPLGTPPGDEFSYFVQSLSFNYVLDVPLVASATEVCPAGANVTFTSSLPPGTVPGDNGTFSIEPAAQAAALSVATMGGDVVATLDVSMVPSGNYTITYTYSLNGCEYSRARTLEVITLPNASLQDVNQTCLSPGSSFNLNAMFTNATTQGGSFRVDGASSDGTLIVPPGGGIFQVEYTVAGGPCSADNIVGMADLTITTSRDATFTINGPPSPACSDGGMISLNLVGNDAANQANHSFTINGDPYPSMAQVPAPMSAGTFTFNICMTATNNDGSCPTMTCQTYVTRNDGNACGANAAFMTNCAPELTVLCPVDTKSDFRIECGFFQLNLGQVADAGLTATVGELSCTDPSLTLNWTGENLLDNASAMDINTPGNPSIASLADLEGFCNLVNNTFCIPIPFSDDLCPLSPLGDLLQCNTSIASLLSTALTLTTQGSRGGLIMADTDGDGAFDYLAEEYGEGILGSAPPTSGTITVPNNVVGSGYISVRNVYGYPDNPKGVCGDPAAGGPDLLEILPIGAIPIAGPIIENILSVAGCSVDLAFTDAATVQIPVYNDQVPAWANCPVDNYYFNTTVTDCTAPANWSIPVAYDACTGLVLPYHGRTNGTTTTYFVGTPSPEVVPGQNGLEEGVYQTGGPVLGSDLPAGVYEIEFTAYSCEARTSTCTFNLVVEEGDLQLICPRDIEVKTDAGLCSAVVSSLEPLNGLSCRSVINYRIDYPAASGLAPAVVTTAYTTANAGTWNLVSGLPFPLGTSTITYTMLIDLNGDGDLDDPNENQTCEFELTVIDGERPDAVCRDLHVTLDNTGSATVFAVDQLDGTAYSNGGSSDNCDTDLTIQIQEVGSVPADFINLDCDNVGTNVYNLVVTDDSGNVSTCITTVEVHEFFEDIQLELDLPELCLGSLNPEQLDFSNYLNITLPDGTVINHNDVSDNAYLGDVEGAFGITAFYTDNGSASPDPGTITADGVYTPGAGSGFITVSYALALPGVNIPQNGNVAFASCLTLVHSTFELRQPLEMESPECECIVQNDRIVNLGEVSGGLEPYTIQYGGVKLDINSDGVADDVDGEYVYDAANGHDISDFVQDLGNLLVDYTQPTWTFTVVDARGCELFRSGSCDNDDEVGTPEIDCTALGAVTLYTRNEAACHVQDVWQHTLPTDNCDVILYTYTIENPDGTIAGPFDLTALVNPDITNPLPDQFYGEYDFQHHSPTENVSTVTYYAEDAVGNFSQCSFTVTVIDDDPPSFINCPEPAVIVAAPESWCSAYANYSLPLAEDNCGGVVVSQIDDTGLTSGALFPVGITINTYEAVDETGNSVTCDVKIIVNDYHAPPSFECPDDVATTTDPGECGAVVENIAPTGIVDNCPDNVTVVYRIDDENGNEVASGLDDASGTFFDLGTSTVSYAIQDMPLLLITEVTHELSNTVDGSPATTPSCFDGILNGDEADVDCGGSVCPSCNCTDNELTVEIALDNNPAETTWTITEPNDGTVLASGGPYALGAAGTTVVENVCLPDGCYDFVIRDAGLDGICCASGNGSYSVTTGGTVLASGGEFGTREVTNFCLDGAPAPESLAGTAGSRDAIEITNFGSANLDVSCLTIERVFAGGSKTYSIPNGAILAPGGVLTLHFANGHDDAANNVFYVNGSVDLAINEPTAYIVSLSRSIIDVVVLNDFDISGLLAPPTYDLGGLSVTDYWSGSIAPVYGGGIIRTTVWDTDTAADFVPGEACLPLTIGLLNPLLPQPTPNGTSTAIQAQPTVRVECTPFTVTVTDDEPAVCGLYADYISYTGSAETINYGDCVESTITVTDVYAIADLNLLLEGASADFGDLTITLISPSGTAIELLSEVCSPGTAFDFTLDGDPEFGVPILDNCLALANGQIFVPVGNIEAFNGEAVQGDWTLQIAHNGVNTTMPASLNNWSLEISGRDPYDQGDVVLENDLDQCGALFTWNHPILFDNCPGGSVEMTITFEDGTVEQVTPYPIFAENTSYTYFFQVGTTEVEYTLTDAAGNVSSCGFIVTVNDTQFPEITCPADLVIQLDPGECETIMYPTTPVFEYDNCPDYTLSSFPPGTPVPIGDTVITLIITDASGNVTECTYNLSVLEHVPTGDIACVADLNISLDASCEAEVTADMVLSGDDYRCYDNYVVTLYPDLPDTGVGPIPTSPFVGPEYVGQTIVAEVCDPATGLCCWGYLNIEFYDAPEFDCPSDATVTCIDATHPDALGYPLVTSCVPGGATIEFDDVVVDNGTCGDPRLVITRTWTVTDGFGNSAQCVQEIIMQAFDLDQVVFPGNFDGITNPVLDCGDVLNDPDLTEPENTGYPTIDGVNLYTNTFCSAAMNYTDEQFYICENSFILFRTWRVINQCLDNPLAEAIQFTQTIRVEDVDGPDLTCPEDETISVAPFACVATYQVPILGTVDACSAVTYHVAVDGDTLTYNPMNEYTITDLQIGDHLITYLASDECGKTSSCSYTLTVEDQIEPTAICDDELNVSLGGGDIAVGLYGEARLLAADVDEGSNDNCSTVSLQVRRNYWRDGSCDDSANRWSPWGDFVDFYCCDIDREITIELKATDAAGNENTCWQIVVPEDKINPYCYAPDDVTLTCVDLPLTFPGDIEAAYDDDFAGTSIMMSALFGNATGTDNCAVDTIVERTPNIQINECGWGTITRRFEAWQLKPEGDANGNGAIDINEVHRSTNSCSQLITITEVHDFVIDFPQDAEADCGDPDVPTIDTETDGCDVLSINIGDPVRFSATGDECYKMSITYDVINWCLWDGEYTGHVLPRFTEDDGEPLPVDRAVEANERPIVIYNDADGLIIDRDHERPVNRPDFGEEEGRWFVNNGGDSSIPNNNEFPGFEPNLPNYGRYIYTQFVKVYDSTAPEVAVGEYGGPTDNCPDLLPGQFGDDDGDCQEAVSIPFSISDDCELFDNDGNLVVSIVSAELDAFAVDANGDGDIKANEFVADFDVVANITDNGDGTYSFDGVFPIITSAMGDNVVHAVRILFEDGCGNQTSETIEFDVIDCKGPAPVCINGLTVTLMPQDDGSCAMAIWASDFEGSPISDCTGQGPEEFLGKPRVTKYAIYRASDVEADPDFVPSPDDTGLVLTQDDEETTVVYVYAFDEEGNYDYCETYVLVQQHVDCGGGTGTINGIIATEENETVEGVEVSVNGGMASMTTNADGTFSFTLSEDGDYTITPYLNANPLNGVTTFDLVLISKHVLGTQALGSPYRMLAADANRSNTVTTLDMIQLRKLILNIDTEFQSNTSWRFVDANYVFPNTLDPWQTEFPELVNVNNHSGDVSGVNFVAVKVGDVNGSAQSNALAGDDRTLEGIYNLLVEDIALKTGNTYTVAVTGENLHRVIGFQGTLQLEGVQVLDIEYAEAKAENFGLRFMEQGYLTMSWNEELVKSNAVLFSLVIRAEENRMLSEVLRITSRYTMAEAYEGEKTQNLGLEFTTSLTDGPVFELYQNTPNPFRETTLISFHLPAANEALITISDVNGKVLHLIKGEYGAGYNTLQVTKAMLQGASGVVSYTLQSGEYTMTRQMIVVE